MGAPDLALHDICAAYSAFRPPKRVSVSHGAAENLYIKQPGGYTGPWSPTETPYMVEPMDMLASRVHEAVCFVGPARTGKTMGLLDGWMAHAVTCDPGDMLIVQMTQDKARDFSKTRIDRAIRNSPTLLALMSKSAHADNTHDKLFKHGMWVKIGWPTVSQLSSSDYRYVAFTDYDRMPDDIDGEGAPFPLGLKRTTTFLSRGMCLVESSPGRDIADPNWKPATPHEAPPCTGILGIYNRSDRRRWHWPCPHCGEYFEATPGLGLFNLPNDGVLLELVRTTDLDELTSQYNQIVCPHNGCVIDKTHKHNMNLRGVWVAEGQYVTPDGTRHGEAARSSIAGYWLGGVAAAYQSWHSLVKRYLEGLREYALSGSELTLQTTMNTDQGVPYISRHLLEAARTAGDPQSRTEKTLNRFIVPDEARFLAASVDVQGGTNARFVVQVHAIGEHQEQWLIDRFNITESRREGVGGGFAPLDPAAYPEDWDTITDQVVNATYRLSEEGRELRIKRVAVDTGGEDGVTECAYDWYRRLRYNGLHGNVILVKGASTKNAPLIKMTMVGQKKQGNQMIGTNDVPMYLLNTNLLKDAVSNGLKRTVTGPNYYHFPDWLPQAFFDELGAEVRQPDGTWKKLKKRNEAFDLCAYIRAVCLVLGADKINWETPPRWAAPLDSNSDVITRAERQRLQAEQPESRLTAPQPRRRQVGRSAYVSR